MARPLSHRRIIAYAHTHTHTRASLPFPFLPPFSGISMGLWVCTRGFLNTLTHKDYSSIYRQFIPGPIPVDIFSPSLPLHFFIFYSPSADGGFMTHAFISLTTSLTTRTRWIVLPHLASKNLPLPPLARLFLYTSTSCLCVSLVSGPVCGFPRFFFVLQ